MGCIYYGVCSSLVALFLWQQVTHFAAVMAHCGISPSRYQNVSAFVDLCNLREVCVFNMVTHLAGDSEVQLSFHLILWTVCALADLVLKRRWAKTAFLNSKAMHT